MKIFVREEERAVAIGKKGQNVRLAGNLIEMQVDVITFNGPIEEDESAKVEKGPKEKVKKEISEKSGVEELEKVEKEVIDVLQELGLTQIKMLEGLNAADLEEIGITNEQAESVVKAVERFSKR